MQKFKNSKLWKYLRAFILFSAITHLFFLFIYSIFKKDISLINFFDIVDLDLFFPEISKGTLSQILSFITIIVVFFVIHIFFSYKKSCK